MHYLEKEQLEANVLELVVYIHEVSGSKDVDFELCSIQRCQYIEPGLLKELLEDVQDFFASFPEIKKLQTEEWWKLKFVQVGSITSKKLLTNLKLVHILNVSKRKNDFYRLHPGLI